MVVVAVFVVTVGSTDGIVSLLQLSSLLVLVLLSSSTSVHAEGLGDNGMSTLSMFMFIFIFMFIPKPPNPILPNPMLPMFIPPMVMPLMFMPLMFMPMFIGMSPPLLPIGNPAVPVVLVPSATGSDARVDDDGDEGRLDEEACGVTGSVAMLWLFTAAEAKQSTSFIFLAGW